MINNIIKHYGYHWLFFGLFIIFGVVSGFIIAPGVVLCLIWNAIAMKITQIPTINIFWAIVLWLIIFITLFITTRQYFEVTYKKGKKLDVDEIRNLVKGFREMDIDIKTLKPRQEQLKKRKKK